jgi:hypothetical protein
VDEQWLERVKQLIQSGIVDMDNDADKKFFSFRMFLTIFYWTAGTILMVLGVLFDVSIFWGLAVIIVGTILLVSNFIKNNTDGK